MGRPASIIQLMQQSVAMPQEPSSNLNRQASRRHARRPHTSKAAHTTLNHRPISIHTCLTTWAHLCGCAFSGRCLGRHGVVRGWGRTTKPALKFARWGIATKPARIEFGFSSPPWLGYHHQTSLVDEPVHPEETPLPGVEHHVHHPHIPEGIRRERAVVRAVRERPLHHHL